MKGCDVFYSEQNGVINSVRMTAVTVFSTRWAQCSFYKTEGVTGVGEGQLDNKRNIFKTLVVHF